MLKALSLMVGLAAGAAGATAWLLSEPGQEMQPDSTAPGGGIANVAHERLNVLKERVNAALEEGKQASIATEDRMRGQLEAYRGSSSRAASERG
jgi:hypothetical protein